MIAKFTQNIFFERVSAVVILGVRSIVGSTVSEHPFHIGDEKTFVAVIV